MLNVYLVRPPQVGRDRIDSLIFISSGYLRARQTAEECRAAVQNILSFERQAVSEEGGEGAGESAEVDGQAEWVEETGQAGYDVSPPVVIRHELRERYFGELDGTILVNYNKVRVNRVIAASMFASSSCSAGCRVGCTWP